MGQIWNHHEQEGFNRSVAPPACLPAVYACHWERIRQARLLRGGHHRHYYLHEGRTQFDYPQMQANGRILQPYVKYNLLGLISNKNGDLLFGQEPTLTASNPRQQDAISALSDRCNLLPMLHSLSVSASSESACFIEAVEYDGEAYLAEVDGQEMFPVGRLMPDGQHAAYVRYQLNDELTLLLVSTYKPGSIERKLYKTTETGAMGTQIDVNLWPFKTTVWADLVNTGMSVNLITWIPNVMLQGKAFSDYDGSLDQQDNVNSANTQIARILAKHADPMVAFPRDSFREDGTILSSDKAVAKGDTPGSVPEYITWSGELDAAMKNRAFAVNALLMTTEMSPVLLGLKEGAAPTAYKSLRLEAVNSISKANRKALYFSVGLKWALISAQQLENTLEGKGGYAIGPIGVTLRDGIPIDENEQAITITTLTGGKAVMSLERAVGLLIADPAERDAEVARLQAARAEGTPSVFVTSPETDVSGQMSEVGSQNTDAASTGSGPLNQ